MIKWVCSNIEYSLYNYGFIANALSLEYVLLGFLCQGPIHGYSLHKKISDLEAISLVWDIKQYYLYVLLEKLEETGLLSSQLVPVEWLNSGRIEFQSLSHAKVEP
jgi:DNA-binding PadR family transcriptional regulator